MLKFNIFCTETELETLKAPKGIAICMFFHTEWIIH